LLATAPRSFADVVGDQPVNADRVDATGVGVAVRCGPDGGVDHAAIQRAVARLLPEAWASMDAGTEAAGCPFRRVGDLVIPQF